ncbi:MAG: radical SAM/Cys-rich domain protein [Desulfobacterales bacterium]|jgi:radical SAM/Cys-rich protein|nr:radical SAM/Cys-rich domain protein [Desulfobacteraceae bacterium]MBT4365635.1 radical SAM/Cys-rich domain protein [Desulfobacteraceae bacterium]MBT7085145.1 radical SAM/Cys-rich domain protein [Desulfobacterales bacterium]
METDLNIKAINNTHHELPDVIPFNTTLADNRINLLRDKTTTLQVNLGLLCNQECKHCHLDAGPGRTEIMSKETIEHVASYAKRSEFRTIDITGGAPEMNPNINYLIDILAPLTKRFMLRSNLSALDYSKSNYLIDLLKKNNVVIVASFPSINESQTNSQRGKGMFNKSVEVLKKLNAIGYGMEGTGLELNLVSNPSGAFLPSSQDQTEIRFKKILKKKWNISFNNLYSFANAPIGRFRYWLEDSGNYSQYLEKLVSGFNSCSIDGLMCRTLVSVSWEGYVYDCDFNIACDLPLGGERIHISDMPGAPEEGSIIAVANHCYACTSGMGFT